MSFSASDLVTCATAGAVARDRAPSQGRRRGAEILAVFLGGADFDRRASSTAFSSIYFLSLGLARRRGATRARVAGGVSIRSVSVRRLQRRCVQTAHTQNLVELPHTKFLRSTP